MSANNDYYLQQEIRRLEEENRRLKTQQGLPRGHFTGRCGNCGSDDLWDDNLAYGCNKCGKFWTF